MASRARTRQRTRRDIPVAVVLCCWVIFAASMYFAIDIVDWTVVGREAAGKQQRQSGLGQKLQKPEVNADKFYTGSIVVPDTTDRCWQFGFDNRNGKIWDMGFIDCDEFSAQAKSAQAARDLGRERLLAIKKSLQRGGN